MCEFSERIIHPLFFNDDNWSSPTSPKQLSMGCISAKEATRINALFHSRLPYIHDSNVIRNKHYVCYAAEYQSVYFAVGIWSSPVAANRMKDGERILELRRLAISDDSPKFTATWMIAKMVKDIKKRFPELIRLVSYQDTEVHKGTIYKAAGWRAASKSAGKSWTTEKRRRNKEQSLSEKIRWELEIENG